jgi:hypothetical protein
MRSTMSSILPRTLHFHRPKGYDLAGINAKTPIPIMKFTLTFDGELRASGNKPKPEDKWIIRSHLAPQLAELWQVNPVLRNLQKQAFAPLDDSRYTPQETYHAVQPSTDWMSAHFRNLCEPIDVGGIHFLPLVRTSLSLICDLDIQFLRKGEPGELIQRGGDMDNRVKTLFDALRMPKSDEMQFCEDRQTLPHPVHCLLEDDALISGFSVKTGQLLTKPDGKDSIVRLVVNVAVKVVHVRSYNMPLIGD